MNPDLSNARWRKSSFSGGEGGQCVELAHLGADVAVRDSKNQGGPMLVVSRASLDALAKGGHQ